MKAKDVRPGVTVLCCRPPSHHVPLPVQVTKIIRAPGTKKIAFAYVDRSGAARDTNGITSPYLPVEEVDVP